MMNGNHYSDFLYKVANTTNSYKNFYCPFHGCIKISLFSAWKVVELLDCKTAKENNESEDKRREESMLNGIEMRGLLSVLIYMSTIKAVFKSVNKNLIFFSSLLRELKIKNIWKQPTEVSPRAIRCLRVKFKLISVIFLESQIVMSNQNKQTKLRANSQDNRQATVSSLDFSEHVRELKSSVATYLCF